MKTIIRNILALVTGLIGGSAVNMALISLGHAVIPLPEGADVSSMESLAASMPMFGPEQFIFPFLAHALGTFAGAALAALIAASYKAKFAYVIGIAFLAGGVMMVLQLPAPMWFNALDLALAYLPMAWLATKVTIRKN